MTRQVGIPSLNLRKVHFGTILHVELENGGKFSSNVFPFQVGVFLGRTGGVEKSVGSWVVDIVWMAIYKDMY